MSCATFERHVRLEVEICGQWDCRFVLNVDYVAEECVNTVVRQNSSVMQKAQKLSMAMFKWLSVDYMCIREAQVAQSVEH